MIVYYCIFSDTDSEVQQEIDDKDNESLDNPPMDNGLGNAQHYASDQQSSSDEDSQERGRGRCSVW